MVEKGMTCVKYLLFAFNLLFFLIGAALIGIGAYVQIELAKYNNFTEGVPLNGAAIVMIVVGVITFIVGFFGCCGAIKENHCMLITFSVLIGVLLICEVGAGIAGFVLQGDIRNLISDAMNSSMTGYNKTKGVEESWDKLQEDSQCCGTSGAKDWTDQNMPIPSSCCKGKPKTCSAPYKDGCLDKLEEVLKSNIGIVAGAGIGLAVVELIGIILACCLARSVRSEYEVA